MPILPLIEAVFVERDKSPFVMTTSLDAELFTHMLQAETPDPALISPKLVKAEDPRSNLTDCPPVVVTTLPLAVTAMLQGPPKSVTWSDNAVEMLVLEHAAKAAAEYVNVNPFDTTSTAETNNNLIEDMFFLICFLLTRRRFT